MYGIWVTDKYHYPDGTWLLDGAGNIIHTDFLGIAKAQANRRGVDSSGTAEVRVIGVDGEPVEIE